MGLKWNGVLAVFYNEQDIMHDENIYEVLSYFSNKYDVQIDERQAENILRFVMYNFLDKSWFDIYVESENIPSKWDDIDVSWYLYKIFEDYMDKQKYEIEDLSEDEKEFIKDGGEQMVFDIDNGKSLIIHPKLSDRPNPEDEFSLSHLIM